MANDDLAGLERRALELAKNGDFGPEATEINAAIAGQMPTNVSAWTRLGRCHLEQRNWDEAVQALRTALMLSPTHTVATSLLNEVRKRRAMSPTALERATTGFSTREFAMLATQSGEEACASLGPRIETLFEAVNASSTAARIVEARRRLGESGSKLFHANDFHAGDDAGSIIAFHHGGRWEPQFSLGWFSRPPMPASCMRIGIGFNASPGSRDSDRLASERVLQYFERFQRTIAMSWTRELARWMSINGGFIQYGNKPLAADLTPERAVDWLLHCQHAAALGWVFVGRWLFLERPDDAKILANRSSLARVVDDTFRALLPLWLTTYTGADPIVPSHE